MKVDYTRIAEDEDLNIYDFGKEFIKMGRTARGERQNMPKNEMAMQKKMKKKKVYSSKGSKAK